MATKKTAVKRTRASASTRRVPATKKTARKTVDASKNGFHAGQYTVPRGHVSIGVPPFWTLRQTNDDLELDAPSGATSVIVNAYQRNAEIKSLDARMYLHDFLERLETKGKAKIANGSKQRAGVRYRDVDGNTWELMFLSNGNTLLMATCSTTGPTTSKEAKLGVQVLNSLKLKTK